ncbi:DNA-binding protein [Halobacteriovorax vibrionivorans]|uniref:DNA-binding protein n=1 Tax=Halobacteriovorax vibrionivorans TaxID=2152716 RepID=A0ABY0ICD2_9BACT|nr:MULTISPECIES: helix-turn-helix domain-containing protein [Halobacteriovorax]RZF20620.1 DNA-binding protein [Halobacteriovorax vibrionivorans]TGD48969.1 DNA-binding protein [Halobacteriovorax sp. Y22]
MNGSNLNELLNVAEISAILKVSKATIYRLLKSKSIPHVIIGGKMLFIPSDIRDWLEAKRI